LAVDVLLCDLGLRFLRPGSDFVRSLDIAPPLTRKERSPESCEEFLSEEDAGDYQGLMYLR
jgi:hypothetical protein